MAILQYNFNPILTPVRVVSASNLSGTYFNGISNNGVGATLTGAASTLTIDSVVMVNGDRVLLVGQTSAFQNGIYIVSGIGSIWVLTRSDDLNDVENLKVGLQVGVGAGTANAGSVYTIIEPLPAVVGVNDMLYESAQSPGGGSATFSNITVTGTATVVDENISSILTVPNTGLHILDTNASHDLIVAPGSDLTADRTLTLTTGDAARTVTLSGNPTLSDWFDQSVKAADSPSFAGVTLGNAGLHLLDTNASHDLIVAPGSDLTADRTLTVTTGDANRTLDISAASVTVSAYGASLVDDADKLTALTTLDLKRGDSNTWGGGGTSFAFTCAGIVATDVVLVSLIASANNVAVTKCVAGAGTITVDFTADPGAGTIVNFLGIPTV